VSATHASAVGVDSSSALLPPGVDAVASTREAAELAEHKLSLQLRTYRFMRSRPASSVALPPGVDAAASPREAAELAALGPLFGTPEQFVAQHALHKEFNRFCRLCWAERAPGG
jgi:hypothetical protein